MQLSFIRYFNLVQPSICFAEQCDADGFVSVPLYLRLMAALCQLKNWARCVFFRLPLGGVFSMFHTLYACVFVLTSVHMLRVTWQANHTQKKHQQQQPVHLKWELNERNGHWHTLEHADTHTHTYDVTRLVWAKRTFSQWKFQRSPFWGLSFICAPCVWSGRLQSDSKLRYQNQLQQQKQPIKHW